MKHSGAGRASLVIKNEKNALLMRLRDDGKGFDADTVQRGNGLENMKARAAAAGGQFSMQSKPGEGTEISLRLPMMGSRKRGKF